MEKFVIHGGAPLSGTVVPAGNKNGALPILAACVLTEEEVVVRNVPRIKRRRGDARPARAPRRARGRGRGDNEVALCAADLSPDCVEVDRALSERIRASFLLAGPLLARFGRADHAAAGRRRHRPPPPRPAPRRLPRARRGVPLQPRHRPDARRTGLRAADVFMDEPSVMGTENALLAAALHAGHDRHRQRRLRAARPGPRAHAREDGRGHPGHRLQRPDGLRPPGPRAAACTRSAPTTSRSARSWRSRASPAGSCASRTSSPTTCA